MFSLLGCLWQTPIMSEKRVRQKKTNWRIHNKKGVATWTFNRPLYHPAGRPMYLHFGVSFVMLCCLLESQTQKPSYDLWTFLATTIFRLSPLNTLADRRFDSLYLDFKCLTLVVCYFVVLNEIQFKMGSAYFNSQFSLSLNKKRWFKSTAWVSCG